MLRVMPIAVLVMGALQCGTVSTWAAPSKLLGSWRADVSALPVPPGGAPPKSVSLTIADEHDGKWIMTIETVDASGKVAHQDAAFSTDGKPARVVGSMDVDTVSVTCPDASTMVMGASKNKLPSNTRVFTVSFDGTQLTETIVGHLPDGAPVQRTNSWTRVR